MTVQARLILNGSWTKLGNDGTGKINSGWEINELLKKNGHCEELATKQSHGIKTVQGKLPLFVEIAAPSRQLSYRFQFRSGRARNDGAGKINSEWELDEVRK